MIKPKSEDEIKLMRHAGNLAAKARVLAGSMIEVGRTTKSIDESIKKFILSHNAKPTFLGYRDYPASSCISVNDEVIHGIPSSRRINSGDIVSIDIGVTYKGYIGDCAATFVAGEATQSDLKLIEVTRECFFKAFEVARVGNRISDLSKAVEKCALSNGFSVVKEYSGHGVGSKLHEPPDVPNYFQVPRKTSDPRLIPGMTLAIEPMINMGTANIYLKDDDWTVVTADGMNSAHFENTILITKGDPEILTLCEDMP